MRWAGFWAGAVVLLATVTSLLRTLIVPRGLASHLTAGVARTMRMVFFGAAALVPGYRRKDKVLAFYGPVMVLALLGTWLGLFLFGYAFLMLPFVRDSFAHTLRETAASMLTLGAGRLGTGATVVSDLAAATGLITVAMLIAYLPTMYSAFNRRETLVTTLQTRAGVPAWGPEILARHHLVSTMSNLPKFYADWEHWAADVAESHASYPVMIYFRSPHPLRSWLLGLLAVMDSAAIYLALAPSAAPADARLCLRQGFTALRDIASVVGIPFDHDPMPDTPIELTYEEFADGVARLANVGFPMERTVEQAWPHFRGWRVNYEPLAYELADKIYAPPGPWSGPRTRFREERIEPLRPVDRKPGDAATAKLKSEYRY